MRLGQIRRRLRLLAAVEGGIAGAALAMLALAVGVALARGRGGAPARRGGGGRDCPRPRPGGDRARGARRIPLARCARLADAALDGQDRLLSALCLDTDNPSPFARALVADAVRRAARLVAEGRGPRPSSGRAAGAGDRHAGAGRRGAVPRLLAGRPRACRRRRKRTASAALPAGALDAEREAARAAAEAAARLGDARLAALAADFDRALRRLASGTLSDPAALDLLRALEARAAEAARAAKRDAQAAEAAARALEANAETRAAGKALAQSG